MQLVLPIHLPITTTFANYVKGENTAVFTHLQNLLNGQERTPLFLYGDKGVGKTHLLQASCHNAAQQQQEAIYLPLHYKEQFSPAVLEGLEKLDLLCIDNLEALSKPPLEYGMQAAWEEALFHCYNRCLQNKTRLIFAAQKRPHELSLQLPDLISRLQACLVLQLKPLSDKEKTKVLLQKSQERGFEISEEVVNYLLHHTHRDLPHLLSWIDRLDQFSLSTQRKITLPLLRQCLENYAD
jgi:DnaA family protein